MPSISDHQSENLALIGHCSDHVSHDRIEANRLILFNCPAARRLWFWFQNVIKDVSDKLGDKSGVIISAIWLLGPQTETRNLKVSHSSTRWLKFSDATTNSLSRENSGITYECIYTGHEDCTTLTQIKITHTILYKKLQNYSEFD